MSPEPESPVPRLAYTVKQAAFATTLCTKTILTLIQRGELLHRRIGGRIIIPKSALESFLKRSHATLTPEERETRKEKKRERMLRKKSAADTEK